MKGYSYGKVMMRLGWKWMWLEGATVEAATPRPWWLVLWLVVETLWMRDKVVGVYGFCLLEMAIVGFLLLGWECCVVEGFIWLGFGTVLCSVGRKRFMLEGTVEIIEWRGLLFL